jgi:hypothetical protein
LSQSDFSPISEERSPNNLDPSSQGANGSVPQAELATITESDPPANVNLSTIAGGDRPVQDDPSPLGKGDLPAQDDFSASADVDPAAHHDLASATRSDAVAESDPLALSTQHKTSRSDPTETLAMDMPEGVNLTDPTTVVANWTGYRES